MKTFAALSLFLVSCYIEPGPGPSPSPSYSYYECDTYVECGDGRYTYTTYTGCNINGSYAADNAVDRCLNDYYYTCGGYVYCSATCYGGTSLCRSDDQTNDEYVIDSDTAVGYSEGNLD